MTPARPRFAILRRLAVALLVLHPWATPVRAASLASVFDEVLRFEGVLQTSPRFRQRLEGVIASFERTAVRSADFVATATTPGFAYTFDPATGVFTRTEAALGPVYVEPASTVGRGGVNVSLAYQYADFDELDGQSLEQALDSLRQVRGTDVFDIRTRKLELRSQIVSVSGTYGVTDRLDVNLLVPIFITTLQLNGASVLLVAGADPFTNQFVARETAVGPGDLLLRAKYRFADWLGLQLASLLTLRLPTGDTADFQGIGDVTVAPILVAQRRLGPHLVQANLGIELNAGDVARSRLRYAVGASVRLIGRMSLLLQVVGSSGFADDDFSEGNVSGTVPRTDIVDGGGGLEIALTPSVFAYLGALVPLTNDGLRAPVVPGGLISMRF